MAETLDLDAIRARCDAATEGPWFVTQPLAEDLVMAVPDEIIARCGGIKSQRTADAEFIAHARRDIPALIAHARRDIPALIAEIERLRSGVTADV